MTIRRLWRAIALCVAVCLCGCAAAETCGDFVYEKVAADGAEHAVITGYTGSDAVVVIPSELDGIPVTGIGFLAFSPLGSITFRHEDLTLNACIRLEYAIVQPGDADDAAWAQALADMPGAVRKRLADWPDARVRVSGEDLEIELPVRGTPASALPALTEKLTAALRTDTVEICDQDGVPFLTGADIARADSGPDSYDERYSNIWLELTDDGAERLYAVTAANVGRSIEFYLNGMMLMNPVIQMPISDGMVMISALFTAEEAASIAASLNADPLPAELRLRASPVLTESDILPLTQVWAGAFCPLGIEIPDTVTTIEDGAFLGAYDLQYIRIPASVTQIGERAFDDLFRPKDNPSAKYVAEHMVVLVVEPGSYAERFCADHGLHCSHEVPSLR
ncbi:MAG: leucine-rich repeat protein [Clostridia bacterium]|nr:leucine-rich repeat protein [Clostridia bacterium]